MSAKAGQEWLTGWVFAIVVWVFLSLTLKLLQHTNDVSAVCVCVCMPMYMHVHTLETMVVHQLYVQRDIGVKQAPLSSLIMPSANC